MITGLFMHFIGEVTLTFSMLLYLIWLVPQIGLNFKRQNTVGLSIIMHGILCLGYISDLTYGFGLDMQWQYRVVTIVGLISLAVQHFQFGKYGLQDRNSKSSYILLNILLVAALGCALVVINHQQSKNFYDIAGMLTNLCWFSYMLPQIVKNHLRRSTAGLSVIFVALSICLNLCDTTSAWALHWDYPSKIGAPLALFANLILLFQVKYYGTASNNERLASDSQWQPSIS